LENRDYARILYETADLMEIAGDDGFRIRSYRNGASTIEGYPGTHRRYPGRIRNAKITDVPGIGKGLAAVLAEIDKRGSCDAATNCCSSSLPPHSISEDPGARAEEHRAAVRTLSGPDHRRTRTVVQRPEAAHAAAHGREARRESSARHRPAREHSGRFLLNFADNAANEMMEYLSASRGIEKITAAGSLRRGKETIGDVDLLVTGPNAAAVLERVATHPRVHEVLGRGANKTSVKTRARRSAGGRPRARA
jgi:DNA polymerase (family 10)